MPPPRILLYDIEVTPTLGWVYSLFDANVIKVEREPHIMCFSYKWLGDKFITTVAQPDYVEYTDKPYGDKSVTEELWRVLDEADIVIAHNATRFDNRVANERFLCHRLGMPSPYKTVDTLRVVKRHFKNGSNALNNLCEKLALGHKTATKHNALWYKCLNGDERAWSQMKRYCERDVRLVEKLYLTVLPFINNHPNLAVIMQRPTACPRCGSVRVQYRGYAYTNAYAYHRVCCKTCGAWSRERVRDEDGERPDYVNITN